MMDTLEFALFLVAVAIVVVSCIVIFRNRRKAHIELDDANIKVEGKQLCELEQEDAPVIEEKDQPLDAIEQTQLEIEVVSEETLSGIDESSQHDEKGKPSIVEQVKNDTGDTYGKLEESNEVEEVLQIETIESISKEEVHPEPDVTDRYIAPEKRGGRPRTSSEEQEKQSPQESHCRTPKPEIVCWNRERQWIVGIEIPAELLDFSDFEILQNRVSLEQDESREACWQLKSVCGNIVVRCSKEEEIHEIEIVHGQEGYLLFKLSGQNQNEGRRLKSPLLGWHLVLTPKNWYRDETLSGPPPAAPESVAFDNYQAHFFINEKGGDSKIAFLTSTGEPLIIESNASRFELTGTHLPDITENVGPLFGQRPPRIRGVVHQAWKDMGTIVVGEEGSGKGKWRKAFYPDPGGKEQDLPPEITNRKDGWYFLRFYDTNDELIESLDFRVVSALHKVRTLQSSPFPSEDGHEPSRIELHHDFNFVIKPADDLARKIQLERENNKTILIVPPASIYDETQWFVGSSGQPQVQASFLVERIWWAIEKEENSPSQWGDEIITLQHGDFNATSNRALWLRLPRRRWAKCVYVGFEHTRARPYTVKVTEREVIIPLREFGDFQELREPDRDHFLSIWIEHDKEPIEGPVAIIPASVTPILCIGWGRKKRATAAAVLRKGNGVIKVNGQVPDEYFAKSPLRARQFLTRLIELPEINQLLNQVGVFIEVKGSSPESIQQVKASAHALARALMAHDPGLSPLLTQEGFRGVKVTEKFNARTGR